MLHLRLLLYLSLQLLMIRVKILQILLFWKRWCHFFLSPTLLLVLLYIIPATSDTSKVVNKSDDQLWDEMMSSERGECSPIPGLFIDDDTHVL